MAEKGYEPFITSGQPDMKLAIVSCMDTRLTKLLPNALGLRNGDAKIIKVAGGTILTPYDSVMRSLLVAIYELGCQEVMIIHHSGCGACDMNADHFLHLMRERGITDEAIKEAEQQINLNEYLDGFHDTEAKRTPYGEHCSTTPTRTKRHYCTWFYHRLTYRRTNTRRLTKHQNS